VGRGKEGNGGVIWWVERHGAGYGDAGKSAAKKEPKKQEETRLHEGSREGGNGIRGVVEYLHLRRGRLEVQLAVGREKNCPAVRNETFLSGMGKEQIARPFKGKGQETSSGPWDGKQRPNKTRTARQERG